MIFRHARARRTLTLTVWVLAGLTCAGAPASAGLVMGRASLPLAGKVVGIDPGHNGRN